MDDSVLALKSGDIQGFAKLLNQSHSSLRYDYEVSGTELDTLVDESIKHPAVIGARMTGGGFTGCALALVKKEGVDKYKDYLQKVYYTKSSLNADFLDASPCDGVRELTE